MARRRPFPRDLLRAPRVARSLLVAAMHSMQPTFIRLHDPKRWPRQAQALERTAAGCHVGEPGTLEATLGRTSHEGAPDFQVAMVLGNIVEADPQFWSHTLPFIAKLALASEVLFPAKSSSPLHYLPPGLRGTVRLTRVHAASVLALAFFDAIAPHKSPPIEEDWDMPEPTTCRHWWGIDNPYGGDECDEAKLICLVHYFKAARESFASDLSEESIKRLASADLSRASDLITISRLVVPEGVTNASAPEASKTWLQCDAPLQPLQVVEKGGIEDAPNTLQADFANEYIGGGVLCGGNVQEEIRFSICPECLVSMLLCPRCAPLITHDALCTAHRTQPG